jgi:excisionase family DNA binding protein
VRTVGRRVAKGRVRSTTIGRRRLLHRDDLDALAAAGEETAPTAPPRRRTGVK